jgi:purine-binding chemotaxis protein CheW
MSTDTVIQTEEQNVVFVIGNESYGIDIFRVNEIIRLREITPIPRSESHIRGLVNLRGKTIPVVDLAVRLSLNTEGDTDNTRIIVVDTDQGHVGIIVDEVREVVTLKSEEVEATPTMVTELSADFIRGVAKQPSGLITLLDLDLALAA